MQTSIDFACGDMGKVDCAAIQANGTCYLPDTRYSHASYAMNEFYVNSTDPASACNFQGAARVVSSDPSKFLCWSCNSVGTIQTSRIPTLNLANCNATQL